MKKRAIFAAAFCVLASGQISRANPPVDPLLNRLNQQRKVALPVWDSIVNTPSAISRSTRAMLFVDEIMMADALMHGTIAPERLAAAKGEAARQPTYQQNGRDSSLAGIAMLQRMVGDEVGSRATQATIDVAYIDETEQKFLSKDRQALLQMMHTAYVHAEGSRFAKSDMVAASSDDLKPFTALYHRILQSPKGKSDRAAMQKVIRRAVKQALDLGEDTDDALWLIASAQARTGDIAGACDTARHSEGESEDRTLLHIAQIQIDRSDLTGARQTLGKLDPWMLGARNEGAEELASAQLWKGDGAAAVRTLDEFPEPAVRQDEKCKCLFDFLTASYAAHVLHALNKRP